MHQNLFDYGNEGEVYSALQRDFKRDHRQIQFMDLVAVALVIYLVRDLPRWDGLAIMILSAVVMSRLNTFIDNSNRNFFMHLIDWQYARADRSQAD